MTEKYARLEIIGMVPPPRLGMVFPTDVGKDENDIYYKICEFLPDSQAAKIQEFIVGRILKITAPQGEMQWKVSVNK